MAFVKFAEHYRVKPNQKISLAKIDPAEKKLLGDDLRKAGEKRFAKLQDELQVLQKVLYAQGKHRILVVIQAMDTGGKDGCVKHVFADVDPQGVKVTAYKAPSAEELAHDYLWRVHANVPANGELAIFNRSHYEDIIAVRVKKLSPEAVWSKRYSHILNFEKMLVEEGTTIIKIFLHISKEEQKLRLEARLKEPAKHWKFNPHDLADRAKWGEFMTAYEETLSKTSSSYAPWYVIPADRKWYRNLAVAEIIVGELKKLKMTYPEPDWDPKTVKVV